MLSKISTSSSVCYTVHLDIPVVNLYLLVRPPYSILGYLVKFIWMRLGSYSLIDEIKVQKQIAISPYMSVSKTKKGRYMNISIKPLFCTTKHTNKTIDQKESERAWHWHDECQIEWRGHWWSEPSRIVPFSWAALEMMRKEYLL